MSSPAENHYRALVVRMDLVGETFDEALPSVPAHLREEVRRRHAAELAIPEAQPAGLPHDPEAAAWCAGFDGWHHWKNLREYLLQKRPRQVVENLDIESGCVLARLGDPRVPAGATAPAPFQKRGLVVGYVQSGKTANFSALIAKAGDAGYRLVIVLGGIHNSLRAQTQRRLAEELGLAEKGVKKSPPELAWTALTAVGDHGDFDPGSIDVKSLLGSKPMLWVVKKNKQVLETLNSWLGNSLPLGTPLPVLVIDDEADQASVDTSLDQQPKPINAQIRLLLKRFSRVSYVGYTATPFANVFINHETKTDQHGDDLYPRDFIIALDRPASYVGASELFGRPGISDDSDIAGLGLTIEVSESELKHVRPEKGDVSFTATLPPSLLHAFEDFVLSGGAFLVRNGIEKSEATPLSMLVHPHQSIASQEDLASQFDAHLSAFQREWRYDKESRLFPALQKRWEDHFAPITARLKPDASLPFDAIVPGVNALLEELVCLSINSKSEDKLSYERTDENPGGNPGLKAVIIGGNRLSRGLTLENLVVSFFVRSPKEIDTMLQMGRWFGHRRDYVDLTRLYTTSTMLEFFQEAGAAEDELREDIRLYRDENLTPLDFGPRVRSHAILRPTNRGKMGAARRVNCSLAARLIQTTRFPLRSQDVLLKNLEATRAFLGSLPSQAKPSWRGIGADAVLSFLGSYQSDSRQDSFNVAEVSDYVRNQLRHGELTSWSVHVVENDRAVVGEENLGFSRPATCIQRSRRDGEDDSIGALIDPSTADDRNKGDSVVDVDDVEWAKATQFKAQHPDEAWQTALNRARDPKRGLLLIYPIGRDSMPRAGSTSRVPLFDDDVRASMPTVIGLAMVFPFSRTAATHEYLVGSAGAPLSLS